MVKNSKSPVMRCFKFLTGDINYALHGGAFYRRVSEKLYHVIDLVNLAEAGVLEEGDPNVYAVSLYLVDLEQNETNRNKAFDCCGIDPAEYLRSTPERADSLLLHALYIYGLRAPLAGFQGPNYTKLMSEAKRESRRLADPVEHAVAMKRVVNRIGQTVEEVLRGADVMLAVTRGVAAGSKDAEVTAAIYGAPQEAINRVREHGESMHSDPLAYMVGYLDGKEQRRSTEEGLADGYIEGYARGLDVAAGKLPAPSWIHILEK